MGVRLTLMDRARLERDGVPVPLEPRFMAVLIRLAVDAGKNVDVDDLSRDVLLPNPGPGDSLRLRRSHVHKCVSTLRKALDPGRPGDASTVLITDRGSNPSYRLELGAGEIDLLRFHHLISAARAAPPLQAISALEEALKLWQGRPLVDVKHHEWAHKRVVLLNQAYDEGRRRLVELYAGIGRVDRAIETANALLADHPGDPEIRGRLPAFYQEYAPTAVNVRRLAPPGTEISVCAGDLFDQDDAHLVVGFSDTFETNTDNDFLVSRASVQGQLVYRLYGGDHRALDRELRKALRNAPKTVESRAVKKYGKLTRRPVGTVAVLHQGGRRIFAVAYSRVDADGVRAQSSMERMRHSLDQLWLAVRAEGQHRPVAMPIAGSGLARIYDLDREGLIELAVGSFLAHARRGRLADELRIVVPPAELSKIDMNRVDELIRRL
ncbi:macro domain-containing protein [Microbispora sp. CA-135349]|uniref:macro domain-containing protein n=1 Tax=Microbispora sp. CA-135349 TaxID=3239953 RepID=UPI003D903B1D